MKVYQDLNIRGGREALQAFLTELDNTLAEGWNRDRDQEAKVLSGLYGRMYCYACSERPGRPQSQLWMRWDRDQGLTVSNILAAQHSSLTPDQYNSILADFFRVCAEPAAKRVATQHSFLGNPIFSSKSSCRHERRSCCVHFLALRTEEVSTPRTRSAGTSSSRPRIARGPP